MKGKVTTSRNRGWTSRIIERNNVFFNIRGFVKYPLLPRMYMPLLSSTTDIRDRSQAYSFIERKA